MAKYQSNLIILKKLQDEIDDAYENERKWVTVIDVEGNAEIFFKYQGTSVFSISEKEINPESLCRSVLKMAKYPRTLTINFLDLPYHDIFEPTYFPLDLLDPDWILNYDNLEKLRQLFLEEIPEEFSASKDFRICFLFRKDNVPQILHEKTRVLEICQPDEIAKIREEREAQLNPIKETKQEEEKNEITENKTKDKQALPSTKTPSITKTSTKVESKPKTGNIVKPTSSNKVPTQTQTKPKPTSSTINKSATKK